MPLDDAIFGEGIYTPREAARLVGVTSVDVLRWTRGSRSHVPVWKGHYQFLDDATDLSFLDLIELRVVSALRNKGISLQAIRFAVRYLQDKFCIERPLSSEQFRVDGREILLKAVEDSDYTSLSKSRAGQKVFSEIIERSVSGLEYDRSQPVRWRPQSTKHVVIDPNRQFGAPIVDLYSVSTSTLHAEWVRSKDVKYVGRLYELDESLVRDAVSYEIRLDKLQLIVSDQGSV